MFVILVNMNINRQQNYFLLLIHIIQHEFMHGLGFYSGWNEYIQSESITPDPSPFLSNQLMLMLNPTTNAIHPNQFLESAMDRLLRVIQIDQKPTLVPVSEYTRKLNRIEAKDLQDLVLDPNFMFAKEMNRFSTEPGSLGIALETNELIVLETGLSPFQPGSSVSHVAYLNYTDTPDFLMRFMQDRGVTLEEVVRKGGGDGPIGPLLLRIFEEIGYATVNNPETVPPLMVFKNGVNGQQKDYNLPSTTSFGLLLQFDPNLYYFIFIPFLFSLI